MYGNIFSQVLPAIHKKISAASNQNLLEIGNLFINFRGRSKSNSAVHLNIPKFEEQKLLPNFTFRCNNDIVLMTVYF
jgi:hypothetical protein